MRDTNFGDLVARLHPDAVSSPDDRALVAAVARCAERVAGDEVDCPLGALVLDHHPVAWFRSARQLIQQDERELDPVMLAAIVDCSMHRRRGDACPLAAAARRTRTGPMRQGEMTTAGALPWAAGPGSRRRRPRESGP